MELVILGSGTGQPLVDRGSPSMALLLDERLVLFDMGQKPYGKWLTLPSDIMVVEELERT